MSASAEYYRRKALELEERAAATDDYHAKRAYEEAAREYLELARLAEPGIKETTTTSLRDGSSKGAR